MTAPESAGATGQAELLPCPFCGNTDLRVALVLTALDQDYFAVDCFACDTSVSGMPSIAEAEERWNARASLPSAGATRQADDYRARFEAVKLQAQLWKQEARTANATIAEIYQICTGATGEPGRGNGAKPVRAALAALATPPGAPEPSPEEPAK